MENLTTVSLAEYQPLPDSPVQYPVEFIEAKGAIKLREANGEVTVGLSEKADMMTMTTIRNFHRGAVLFFRINGVELSSYLGKKMGESADGSGMPKSADADDRVLLDKLANDAPTVNMVNSICIDGIRSGASDIHIEANPVSARVRYRIDGVLRTVRDIDPSRFPAVSSRIKIMANLNILERRQPQDGRITVSVGNENVDLRVSIVPVAGGESIVLRILGKLVDSHTLEDLGFAASQSVLLRKLLRIPHGLVLVTGPTGSGKTTTLNALLREIVSDSLKVITIEDPVEFIVGGANQIQINEQINLGFDVILRRVLRQDPNVIMVGEIRDRPTAEIAIRAALTGHLVLSTLHTNDSVSVIPRLINMGIEPYLIASVLRGAIAQRLVRKVCPHCSEKAVPPKRDLRIFAAAGITVKKTQIGKGCDECRTTGFSGRTVISEAFCSDSGLEELILRNERPSVLSDYLVHNGMDIMAVDGMKKVSDGLTTLQEIERELILSGGED